MTEENKIVNKNLQKLISTILNKPVNKKAYKTELRKRDTLSNGVAYKKFKEKGVVTNERKIGNYLRVLNLYEPEFLPNNIEIKFLVKAIIYEIIENRNEMDIIDTRDVYSEIDMLEKRCKVMGKTLPHSYTARIFQEISKIALTPKGLKF